MAAVGLAGGAKLEHSVIPFLLRGVNLLGIDSVLCPQPRRGRGLAAPAYRTCRSTSCATMTVEVALAEVPRVASEILKGQIRGRVVVNTNA